MMKTNRIVLSLCLTSFSMGLLSAPTALAEHEDYREADVKEVLASAAVGGIFGPTERDILAEYLRHKRVQKDPGYGDDSRSDDDSRRWYYDDRSDSYGQSGYKGRGKAKKLPPGLRKKLERGGDLPPGWQDKVTRGEVIDDELYFHSRPLPEDILHRLHYIEGTSIREIDDRIVRVQDTTRTILDVFHLLNDAR